MSTRYDAILKDKERNETKELKKAIKNRFIVERKFATLVNNHGLIRYRYIRLPGVKIQIIMANITCYVIMMDMLYCKAREGAWDKFKLDTLGRIHLKYPVIDLLL